jgi:hypothetical protein
MPVVAGGQAAVIGDRVIETVTPRPPVPVERSRPRRSGGLVQVVIATGSPVWMESPCELRKVSDRPAPRRVVCRR